MILYGGRFCYKDCSIERNGLDVVEGICYIEDAALFDEVDISKRDRER
jgi:hypothetical protein